MPSTSPISEPSIPPSAKPSYSPSFSPSTVREKVIKSQIENEVLQRGASFANMTHDDPSVQALTWILQDDPMQLAVDDEKVKQRYVLALLAHAWNNIGWLSGADECDWIGVNCTAGEVTTLQLDGVSFDGPIPAELVVLSRMDILDLSNTNIFGEIPPEVGRMENLGIINFSNTSVSGTIPTTLGLLPRLEQLNMDKTSLSGSLPTEIGNLTTRFSKKTCFEKSIVSN